MGILENMLMPKNAASSRSNPSAPSAPKKGGGGPTLYPGDFGKIAKWCVIGAVGFSAYQTAVMMAKRNVNGCVDFKDPVEAMNNDPIIRDALLQMQNYRDLNPWLFKTALQNIDQLLFLENALLSQQVSPVKKDKDIAFTHFRMGVNRLSQFHYIVTKELGTEQGMVVDVLLKRIYSQMQKHLLNILHMCSQFNPENLIARAPLEVRMALRRMEEGHGPEDSRAKWDEMRGKLEREEERHNRRHRKHRHHHRRHHKSSASSASERDEKTGADEEVEKVEAVEAPEVIHSEGPIQPPTPKKVDPST